MKKSIIDDYYNDGSFEIARSGKNVIMKNNMSPSQHSEFVASHAGRFSLLKREIDTLVLDVRKKVMQCDPIELLSFSSSSWMLNMLGKSSEIEYSLKDIAIQRMTEYIQSIIVSSPTSNVMITAEEDPTIRFIDISNAIISLYDKINEFYYSWGMCLTKSHKSINSNLIDALVESQMLYNVRGKRYQIFQIEYLESLLNIHSSEFQNLFGISSIQVLDGLKKLEYAMSQAKADVMIKLHQQFENFKKFDGTLDEWRSIHRKETEDLQDKLFGQKLNNVCEVTGWPDKFVSSLAYGIDEDSAFFSDPEYPGWPIISMPIHNRPFIEIRDTIYCFDYYSLMDNIYRVISKCIRKMNPDYNWSGYQNRASENMVERIFNKILPNSTIYSNNYYPKRTSLKNMVENDLLVLYYDVLLIIEVKAGSFVNTPPITDFDAHIESYKSLIECPNRQCQRTLEYLCSDKIMTIYSKDRLPKAKIDMSKFSDVFMLSVTVDNINEFAARAEKLSFLSTNRNIISISVDDLMVYRTYFESPLIFLHFLKQRTHATTEPKIALNDELDHLGMYIEHNCYSLYVDKLSSSSKTNFVGYREALDRYFGELYHSELNPIKPVQKLPPLICNILQFIENQCMVNPVDVASYLLDFSTDTKTQFEASIYKVRARQKQINRQNVIHTAGGGDSLRYTCFVNTPDIIPVSYQEKLDYALASLVKNSESNRVLLDVSFDEHDIIKDFSFKRILPTDCPPDKYDQILSLGEKIANARIERYTQLGPGKIGRNEKCPCGSGKKYKYCCGKN